MTEWYDKNEEQKKLLQENGMTRIKNKKKLL